MSERRPEEHSIGDEKGSAWKLRYEGAPSYRSWYGPNGQKQGKYRDPWRESEGTKALASVRTCKAEKAKLGPGHFLRVCGYRGTS